MAFGIFNALSCYKTRKCTKGKVLRIDLSTKAFLSKTKIFVAIIIWKNMPHTLSGEKSQPKKLLQFFKCACMVRFCMFAIFH